MLLITCPHCGPRPEIEFRHAGEAHLTRDPQGADDAAWTDFLYARTNPRGVILERWRHLHGCARFFNAARSTVSDVILATYAIGEPAPDLDRAGAERKS